MSSLAWSAGLASSKSAYPAKRLKSSWLTTQAVLCRYRVARLLHTAALRLRKHTQRHGAFQAWNKCLGHLLALARAHIESIVYSRFSLAVSGCTDPDSRKSLKVLFACVCKSG